MKLKNNKAIRKQNEWKPDSFMKGKLNPYSPISRTYISQIRPYVTHKEKWNRHCFNRSPLGIWQREGCFAEYVTLPEKNLLEIPSNVTDEEAVQRGFSSVSMSKLDDEGEALSEADLQAAKDKLYP